MNHTKSLPYLLVLFLLMILSTIHLTEGYTMTLYLIVFIISVIVFSFVSSNSGFILLLVLTIGIGLYHTGVAFYTKASNLNQVTMMFSYFIVLVGIALLWLIFHFTKNMQKEHVHLQKTVETLKKFETNERIFTKTEFIARAILLYTGMKRRNETGYLIVVTIDQGKKYIQPSLFHAISHAALQSIRQEYDLAGKLSNERLVIFLQNTNEEGSNIVLHRFEQKMEKELDLSLHPYQVNKMVFTETICDQLKRGELVV